jgi:O-methyltransferase
MKHVPQVSASSANLYLDLMKKALLASIYDENGWYVLGSLEPRKTTSWKQRIKLKLVDLAWSKGFLLVKPTTKLDADSANWGTFCYTMVGLPRLDNIQACIEDVLRNNIEGDLIETGVWRGGATIFMRAVLKAHNVTDRTVWAADSFEGLPTLDEKDAAYKDDAAVDVATMNDGGPMSLGLAVSLEKVKANFEKFDLLDSQVRFLKGWFSDTLPNAPIGKLSILRLDGDMYQSTMDALNALYGKVNKGGFVIVDDYNCWPHCKQAVDDFRAANAIQDAIVPIDEFAVFWKVS